ncbi:phage replisome organizer N-terminal domain-containing protein [Macrococcoides caseolyticum]|uniref:phage replisome organizer N-terminal domain-containing protein n=1 Tax=Macrococcoides caseolyticum TaxID=69966 RepID=UPI000C31EECA|nr:phage replisome organizer N-terminal domain-containing protein [Macrococcus caseolyticus]PKD98567.1 DnaD domain protein [Macrococcus caseolyticus]PKF18768.1 DnaD domain protein [Macrococcus caseolyticus]
MADITWVKLKTDMFDNEKIKLIEALPDSDTILIIWIKLIAYAGKVNAGGYIMLTENIPMNEEELATIFNRPLNTVRLALNTFERYGMITKSDEGAIKIANWEIHQNIDGMERVKQLNAIRNRKYRERKKQKQLENNQPDDVSVTSRDDTEEDIDKELDIDIERDKDKDKRKVTRPSSFDIFENGGYGYLDPITMQKLFAWIDDFGDEGDSIVSKALDVGIEAGVKNYSYVNGTLKNWYNKGFRTIAEIDANERRRKSKDNNQVKPNVQTTKRSPEEIARLKERNERNMRQMLGGEDVEIITE